MSRRPPSPSSWGVTLPRWQPDAAVTYCPICNTQFSMWVRKHHCRKCGRVVCNSCSPHRIIIPHQFIVRPVPSEPVPSHSVMGHGGNVLLDINGPSGGERVRLCNPCVPDPNTAPPHVAATGLPDPTGSPHSQHHRSRSSISDAFNSSPSHISSSSRYGGGFPSSVNHDSPRSHTTRMRSITTTPSLHSMPGSSSSRHRSSSGAQHASLLHLPMGRPTSYPTRHSSLNEAGPSSHHQYQRRLPPPPQIAEEDECPICHRELPHRSLPNFEEMRETHINMCIQSHSTYGGSQLGNPGDTTVPAPAPRRTGMYTYPATEKDCIDDAECTICLEEFVVGIPMARLECLCRFHRDCIRAWFINHPGRCPVHQHDGFGY